MRLSLLPTLHLGACIFLLFCETSLLMGQSLPSAALTDTIPQDPGVRRGRLDNGFTYYIARNTSPIGKVSMQLTVKAGVVLQDSDQVELGHVLEHLAFGETKHFRSVFGYLDSLGLRRGADVNGGTGNDETIYWAVFPANGEMVNVRNLWVMHDFAQGLIISPENVERERNVVMREVLGGGGYSQRFYDKHNPRMVRNSEYAKTFRTRDERVAALRAFDLKSLSRFYEDWYRPDLQALIIVGDIDVTKVEQQVREMFKDLKIPIIRKSRATFDVPLANEGEFMILTDEDIVNIEVRFSLRRSRKICYTLGDYKNRLIEQLYADMMRSRFAEIQRKFREVYISAKHYDLRQFYPGLDVLNTHLILKSNNIRQGVQIAIRELERVILYGFNNDELDHAKKAFLNSGENMRPEASQALVSYYSNNFTTGSAAPAAEVAERLKVDLLATVSLGDVNSRARELLRNPNQDISIFSPVQEAASLPDETTILAWIDSVRREDIVPFKQQSRIDDKDFLAKLAMNGNASAPGHRRYIRDVDVTELHLPNGARVVIKSVKKKDDSTHNGQLKIYAFNSEGASLYSGADYYSALYAAEIVEHGGLVDFDKSELEDFFLKHDISGYPFIWPSRTGFSGQAKADNAEMLLQLMCEYYQNPVSREKAFLTWKENKEQTLFNTMKDPQAVFWNIIDSLRRPESGHKNWAKRPLDNVSRDAAYRIYKERFVAGEGLVVVMVGDFDVEDIVTLSTRYIGSIPSGKNERRAHRTGRNSTCKELSRNVALGGDSLKADVSLIFDGRYRYSAGNNLYLDALEILLQDVLSHRLRDTEGAVYTVYVETSYSQARSGKYSIGISFSCFPVSVEMLISAVMEEVNALLKDGISKDLLQSVKSKGNAPLPSHVDALSFWNTYLVRQYENDASPSEIVVRSRLWDELVEKKLQKSLKKFVRKACFNRFVLIPK